MAAQAKKTLADYEASIPVLEKTIVELNSTIASLDRQIDEKKANYEAKDADLKVKYDAIEEKMKQEYETKWALINEKEVDNNAKSIELYEEKNRLRADIEAKEVSISQAKVKLHMMEQALINEEKNFEQRKEDFRSWSESEKKEIELLKSSTKELHDAALEKNREANDRLFEIGEKEVIVNKVLEREAGLEAREKGLDDREDALDKKQDEISSRNTAVAAEKNRLLLKEKELKEREKAIAKREENVKLAEAKIDG
jgi:chromosome segregation ATPase